jgi:hypothetical protein
VLQLQTWGGGCGGLLSAFPTPKGTGTNCEQVGVSSVVVCHMLEAWTGWSPILVTERAEDGRREDAPGLDGRELPGIVRIAIYDGQKRSNLSK